MSSNKNIKMIIHNKEQRLIYFNIFLSLLFKFASMCISLINTKLYIQYFGNNTILGAWYAMVSILSWIINFDLGIGNGLRNGIVIPYERKEYNTVKVYISSSYIIVGAISLFIFLFGGIGSYCLNWNVILNVSSYELNNTTLTVTILVSLLGVCSHFFLKIITSITNALRITFVSGIIALFNNIIVFTYLATSNYLNTSGNIIILSVVYAVSVTLPLIVTTIIVFRTVLKDYRPRVDLFDREIAFKIMSIGLTFFAIQIALMLTSSTDSFFISFLYSSEYAVDYQLYYRFFSISLTVYVMFSQTIWSSVTKYKGEGNNSMILKLYKFLNLIALLGGIACLILALFFEHITDLFMQDTYHNVEFYVSILFVLWFFVQMVINSSTAIANGLGELKCQMIFVPLAAVIKVVLVFLFSILECSWETVVVSNILSLLPLAVAQHWNIVKKIKGSL